MSKMDELRALREARYERTLAGAAARTQRGPAEAKPRKPTATTVRPSPAAADRSAADPGAGLCGHRAISGRTCTRELGHAAKSHRYS